MSEPSAVLRRVELALGSALLPTEKVVIVGILLVGAEAESECGSAFEELLGAFVDVLDPVVIAAKVGLPVDTVESTIANLKGRGILRPSVRVVLPGNPKP